MKFHNHVNYSNLTISRPISIFFAPSSWFSFSCIRFWLFWWRYCKRYNHCEKLFNRMVHRTTASFRNKADDGKRKMATSALEFPWMSTTLRMEIGVRGKNRRSRNLAGGWPRVKTLIKTAQKSHPKNICFRCFYEWNSQKHMVFDIFTSFS